MTKEAMLNMHVICHSSTLLDVPAIANNMAGTVTRSFLAHRRVNTSIAETTKKAALLWGNTSAVATYSRANPAYV